MEIFVEIGYTVSKKDKCVFIKREEGRVAFCGTERWWLPFCVQWRGEMDLRTGGNAEL